MRTDIENRLQDTVPEQLPPLDHDRLQRRGRRRRHVKRASALAGVSAVVAAAVLAFPWPGGDVMIDGGFAGSGEADGQRQDAVDWAELSVTEAYLSIAGSQARVRSDRSSTERHEVLVERIPVGTSADDIRAKAVEARDADDQEAATVEETAQPLPR